MRVLTEMQGWSHICKPTNVINYNSMKNKITSSLDKDYQANDEEIQTLTDKELSLIPKTINTDRIYIEEDEIYYITLINNDIITKIMMSVNDKTKYSRVLFIHLKY